jgi:hypothetical protein
VAWLLFSRQGREKEERNHQPWKAAPEKTRRQQCDMAKNSAEPEVEDEGNKVISPTLSLHKSEKLIKYWLWCVTAKNPEFVMVQSKCRLLRCPSAMYFDNVLQQNFPNFYHYRLCLEVPHVYIHVQIKWKKTNKQTGCGDEPVC